MPTKSPSTGTAGMQSKIGDASLKFGPDWLRALSSDSNTGGGSMGGTGSGTSATGGPPGHGWSTGSSGGGGLGASSSASSERQHQNFHHQHHHHQGYHSRDRDTRDGGRNRIDREYNNDRERDRERSTRQYKLPEFRYTREEILTLYDKNLSTPNFLAEFGTLVIEKMQPPLAFSQPSEDELRIWHVPQPESSRQIGTGVSANSSGSGGAGLGGRGGSYTARGRGMIGIDRGRGRGGSGRGGYGYGSRGTHEEDRERDVGLGFRGSRTYERSQSAHERAWASERERNGISGGGQSGDRDDTVVGRGGGSWRNRNSESYSKSLNERRYGDAQSSESGGGHGDDGWRRGGGSKWRRDDEEDYGGGSRSSGSNRRVHRSWSDDGNDNLPEWAKDNPSEESGTFDSSGAFHEEHETPSRRTTPRDKDNLNNSCLNDNSSTNQHEDSYVQKRSPAGSSISLAREGEQRNSSSSVLKEGEPHTTSQNSSLGVYDSAGAEAKGKSNASITLEKSQDSSHTVTSSSNSSKSKSQLGMVDEENQNYFSMIEEADSLVARLIEEDGSLLVHEHHQHKQQRSQSVSHVPTPGVPTLVQEPQVVHHHHLLSQSQNQPQQQIPPSPMSFDTWFYRDPQGNVQGPFSSSEMSSWLSQGYFNANLMLRREVDKSFLTLSDMGKLYGRNPFVPIQDAAIPQPIQPTSALIIDQVPPQSQYTRQTTAAALLQQEAQASSSYGRIQGLLQGVGRNNAQIKETDTSYIVPLQTQMLLNLGTGGQPDSQDLRLSNSPPQPESVNPVASDPIQSLVQQLTSMQTKHQQQRAAPVSGNSWGGISVGGPGSFQQQPQNPVLSAWDIHEQYLKIQQMKAEEEILLRKKEEEKERERQRMLAEEEELRKRVEEQKRRLEEEEKQRKALEDQQQQLLQQQKEIERQKELLRQQVRDQELRAIRLAEDARRQEQLRLEQLEQQRIAAVEQLRLEQQQREREEQERKEREQREREAAAEQQRRLQLQEMEEQKRRQEQQMKALREQKEKFSWNSSYPTPTTQAGPRSLLEIQEEEAIQQQKEEALRIAAKQKLMEQQKIAEQQAKNSGGSAGLSLKWAQVSAAPQKIPTKTLQEIQAEEQEKLAKVQETRREQQARMQQHSQVQHAWSSSLTWANRASLISGTGGSGSGPKSNGGVWGSEDQSKVKNAKPITPQGSKKLPSTSDDPFIKMFQEQGVLSINSNSYGGANTGSGNNKHKSNVGGVSSVKSQDPTPPNSNDKEHEFHRWAKAQIESITKAGSKKGSSIDPDAFAYVLESLENPNEVGDYAVQYLGESSKVKSFAVEFLERRSRIRKAGGCNGEDNLCRPASAINPPTAEFQEVKGKKAKKGKMQKLDPRLMGFNTTGAADRVNVGKRDHGDGAEP